MKMEFSSSCILPEFVLGCGKLIFIRSLSSACTPDFVYTYNGNLIDIRLSNMSVEAVFGTIVGSETIGESGGITLAVIPIFLES